MSEAESIFSYRSPTSLFILFHLPLLPSLSTHSQFAFILNLSSFSICLHSQFSFNLTLPSSFQDINDESPVFASGNAFTITLLETDDLKKPIYVAEATDKDRNYNGAVRYK